MILFQLMNFMKKVDGSVPGFELFNVVDRMTGFWKVTYELESLQSDSNA